NPSAFAAAIQICTPITSDKVGNLYFGIYSTGAALPGFPNGIPSGLVRLPVSGAPSVVSAADLAGDPTMLKPVYNCAPAVSADGKRVFVTVNASAEGTGGFGSRGYLCALNSSNLTRRASVPLLDPRTNNPVPTPDDASGTPTFGPDGDVYFGVLEDGFPANHA